MIEGKIQGMKIVLNGKEEYLDRPITVEELRAAKGWKAGGIVVEFNRQIIDRKDWAITFLQEGDCLEVLSFVGGGCLP